MLTFYCICCFFLFETIRNHELHLIYASACIPKNKDSNITAKPLLHLRKLIVILYDWISSLYVRFSKDPKNIFYCFHCFLTRQRLHVKCYFSSILFNLEPYPVTIFLPNELTLWRIQASRLDTVLVLKEFFFTTIETNIKHIIAYLILSICRIYIGKKTEKWREKLIFQDNKIDKQSSTRSDFKTLF